MYNDIPIINYKLEEIRSQIGLMFNRLDIFQGTILENITIGNPDVNFQDILDLSKKIGLDKFINARDQGYDSHIDSIGKRLPRTVIKKILLMRAILCKRPLIILEEPFTEVEEKVQQHIKDILLNELPNSTVIVVTNDPDFIERANCNLQLDEQSVTLTRKLS
jgi:ABC-type multidrug transport system fused ATPase/permease subunit